MATAVVEKTVTVTADKDEGLKKKQGQLDNFLPQKQNRLENLTGVTKHFFF